jgi:hypothetical protein
LTPNPGIPLPPGPAKADNDRRTAATDGQPALGMGFECMKPALRILKNTAVALLWFGIAYALFFHLAHFTPVQSLVVAILWLCASECYRLVCKIAAKQKPEFAPFWVSVYPNWYSICHDFGLAAGDKWTELQERCRVVTAKYSIIYNGFNFTMLSPTLLYSNDLQSFFGELEFKISIEELKPEPDNTFSFAPQFYVRRTLAGEKKLIPVIEFGLITSESRDRGYHPPFDDANIPIARLPEIVFFGNFNPDVNWRTMTKIIEQTKVQLKDFGWTEEERDTEVVWLHLPIEINHKYLKVRYRGI